MVILCAVLLLWSEGQPAPAIQSMSVLCFTPQGQLIVGDSKGGKLFAFELKDTKAEINKELKLTGLEQRLGSLLGVAASEIMIHDMAVHPLSKSVYFSVSKGRSKWSSAWELPNDVADANLLFRLSTTAELSLVDLTGIHYNSTDIPNPVADKPHVWKEGVSQRADTITDIAYSECKLWVSGLCNEEFASSLWQFDFPFNQKTKSGVTLEIFHGAHGAFETHAPIRTLLPVKLKGQTSLLAAYLCTPFVQFSEEQLKSGGHVKGRTLGEFGSGNYPLEMLQYNKKGEPRVLLVNSNLPMMVLPLNKLAEYEGSITEKPTSYAAGFPYEIRSGAGVLQADNYSDDYLVILQRNPNGSLDLGLMETRRL